MQGLLDDELNRRKQNISKGFTTDDFEKAEGSRGGKVIGHTQSGKPIYASGGNSAGYSPQDHHDAFESHAKIADNWRERKKVYGKDTDKTEVHKIRAQHMELARVHAVARDKDIKLGESKSYKNSDGTSRNVTRNSDGKTMTESIH